MLSLTLLVLLSLCVSSVSGELKFWADTEYRIVVSDSGDGVPETLIPCRLQYTPTDADTSKVSVVWSRIRFGETEGQNIYVNLPGYDTVAGDADPEHYNRTGDVNDPQRFFLRIADFTEKDEGKFCCDLNVNTNPSRKNCTDVHYKLFDKDGITFDCNTKSDNTTDIEISYANPAEISVEFHNFYPQIIPLEGSRELKLLRIESPDTPLAITDNFTQNGSRFTTNITHQWTEAGKIGFLASMAYPYGNYDEHYFECTYVEEPSPPPPPPPSIGKIVAIVAVILLLTIIAFIISINIAGVFVWKYGERKGSNSTFTKVVFISNNDE